jgi:hypothetical protein
MFDTTLTFEVQLIRNIWTYVGTLVAKQLPYKDT